MWNAFADIVDLCFEGEKAGTGPVPRQEYPRELAAVLRMLDRKRPGGWLAMDAAIRNLAGEGRDRLSEGIAHLRGSLGRHRYRWMGLFGGEAMQVWVCDRRLRVGECCSMKPRISTSLHCTPG